MLEEYSQFRQKLLMRAGIFGNVGYITGFIKYYKIFRLPIKCVIPALITQNSNQRNPLKRGYLKFYQWVGFLSG